MAESSIEVLCPEEGRMLVGKQVEPGMAALGS